MNRAIAVVGPTASGKTRLAIALARHFRSEIISADSMQFYRGMEIGTAAPTEYERSLVPHHFIGFLNPDEDISAGQYEQLARTVAGNILQQGDIPIVVGGSGLYIRAFIDGLFTGPARNQAMRDQLRTRAASIGNTAMMEELRRVDPEYAAQLTSENDLVRIIRALEVHTLTGRPYSEWHRVHQATKDPWQVLQVGLLWDRNALYTRIDQRVEELLAAGWVEETQRLLDRGYEKDIDRLKALGYRELVGYLKGNQSLDEALATIKQHHRRYAKRQMTWFRADKRIQWLAAEQYSDLAAMVEAVVRLFEKSGVA